MKVTTTLKHVFQTLVILLSWGYACVAVPYATEPVAGRWTTYYFQPPDPYNLETIIATNLVGVVLAIVLVVMIVGSFPKRMRPAVAGLVAAFSAVGMACYLVSGVLLGRICTLAFAIVLGIAASCWLRSRRSDRTANPA